MYLHAFLYSGLPDFAEVYSFIGSVFDPDTSFHELKLKEMDPINLETVSVGTDEISSYLFNDYAYYVTGGWKCVHISCEIS